MTWRLACIALSAVLFLFVVAQMRRNGEPWSRIGRLLIEGVAKCLAAVAPLFIGHLVAGEAGLVAAMPVWIGAFWQGTVTGALNFAVLQWLGLRLQRVAWARDAQGELCSFTDEGGKSAVLRWRLTWAWPLTGWW